LDFNYFGGGLGSFCSLPAIRIISAVYNNNFYTDYPTCLLQIPTLEYLQLGGNQILELDHILLDSFPPHLRAIDYSANMIRSYIDFSNLQNSPNLSEILFFNDAVGGNLSGVSGHNSLVVFDVHNTGFGDTIPSDFPDSLPNLHVIIARKNHFYGFLPDGFADKNAPYFDFSGNYLNCPLPEGVSTSFATCSYWTIDSIDKFSCPVGQQCTVTITGSDFLYGQDAYCTFGSLSVPVNIQEQNHIKCTVTGQEAGQVSLSITFQGKPISDKSVPFEFTASDNKHPIRRRHHLNADPVHVRLHGESKSPRYAPIITAFQNIMHLLGTDVVDLQLGFIMTEVPQYVTGFWSHRGQTEVIGNTLIKWVEKKYGIVTAVDFAACLAQDSQSIPINAPDCAKKYHIDYESAKKSTISLDAYQSMSEAMKFASADNATWSPTVIINDEVYCLWDSAPCKATKDTDFLRAICDAYKGPTPSGCK